MADYKSMYYHLAGRTATTVDILEATIKILEGTLVTTTHALVDVKEKLKLAQQATEEMFASSDDDGHDVD